MALLEHLQQYKNDLSDIGVPTSVYIALARLLPDGQNPEVEDGGLGALAATIDFCRRRATNFLEGVGLPIRYNPHGIHSSQFNDAIRATIIGVNVMYVRNLLRSELSPTEKLPYALVLLGMNTAALWAGRMIDKAMQQTPRM